VDENGSHLIEDGSKNDNAQLSNQRKKLSGGEQPSSGCLGTVIVLIVIFLIISFPVSECRSKPTSVLSQ
jgi:hypothetical protein